MVLVSGEQDRDFSMFMSLPSAEEERSCYEDFYDATSNEVLVFLCAVCVQEKMVREGEQTMMLSDSSIVEVLTGLTGEFSGNRGERIIL